MTSDTSAKLDELLALAEEADLFAVIERLYAEPDPELAARTFADLAKRVYEGKKNVAAAVALARAGMQFCLASGARESLRPALRLAAKRLAFNLAADTWPGWGDDGVVITASDLDAGFDAARLNLRLARELERGPLAESKAHWLLGAHRLARGQHDAAIGEFSRAEELARVAGNADDEQLNAGYVALVATLRGDAEAESALSATVKRLEAETGSENARSYGEQLVKALAVLRAREAERS